MLGKARKIEGPNGPQSPRKFVRLKPTSPPEHPSVTDCDILIKYDDSSWRWADGDPAEVTDKTMGKLMENGHWKEVPLNPA